MALSSFQFQEIEICIRKGRVSMKKCIFDVNFTELQRLETKRKGILTVTENIALSTCSQTRKRKTQ